MFELVVNQNQGFFKRAISNRRIYRCVQGDESCQMSRKDRNRCQFCRLKKCLHVGMNRKGKNTVKAKGSALK